MPYPIAYDFLFSVKDNPTNTAIIISDRAYSYHELYSYTDSILDHIRMNFRNEFRIGVTESYDIFMYAAILAISLSGKSFVPISSQFPLKRVSTMLQRSQTKVVLEANQIKINKNPREISTCISSISPAINSEAYVLFTSGSTGEPKGVAIKIEQVQSFFNFFKRYEFSQRDVFLQMFSIGFDLSIFSIFAPLSIGASIVAISSYQLINLQVAQLIKKYNCTIALMVPSIIQQIKPHLSEINPSLRLSFFCGEGLRKDDVIDWKNHFNKSQIINLYGPTEATISCTAYELPNHDNEILHKNGIVSIGKPFENLQFFINQHGELLLSGIQVIESYLNQEFSQYFEIIKGEIYYRTGDQICMDSSGNLLFMGRMDNQIKFQGYRIELGEIVYAIENYSNQLRAVVCLDTSSYSKFLHAYLSGAEVDVNELILFLKEKLPDYMIPTKFTNLKEIPLNTNGKVDFHSLNQRNNHE